MIYNNIIKNINGSKISKFSGITLIIAIIVYSILSMFLPIATPKNENDENEFKKLFKYDTMDKCINSGCIQYGLVILLCFIVFIGFYSFERVFPIAGFVILILLSIAVLVYVFTVNKLDTPFEYIKFISIIVATLLLSFTRVSNIKNLKPNFISKNAWSWLLWLILAINIGEAVMTEFKNKHYINPIIGIWLILFMPTPFHIGSKNWKDILFIDKRNNRDLVYKTPIFWVIMYILWNANYSYSERKEHFSTILVVLLSSLLTTLPNSTSINPHLFIQMRTYTLFIRYIILGFNDVYEKYSDTKGWYNEDAKKVWEYINLFLITIYTLYFSVTGNRKMLIQ